MGGGNVCDVLEGKRLPKGHLYSENKTDFPYVRVTDFKNMGVIDSSLKYIKPETAKEISKYTISKNDLYISIAGSIGKVGIIPEFLDNAHLTENAGKLCKIKIDKKFLNFLLNSQYVQQQILAFTKSTTQPKLALYRIKEISLNIPPLNEQKRIVNKIEMLFLLVDYLKQIFERTKTSLKEYRQSVLKSAFNGSLTINWRDNNDEISVEKDIQNQIFYKLENTKGKYQEHGTLYGNQLFKIPTNWIWARLENVAQIGKGEHRLPQFKNIGMRIFRGYVQAMLKIILFKIQIVLLRN